nr:Hypothetical protein CBG05069 [Haemonchus contortus]
MTDILSSPTIKSGNVLALLDTLYASGFASASPSTPMLEGRTMHTLYAVSFIVYVSNCMCDWFHVWATLRGMVTSFPLENWLVISLVVTVVAGSMLTWLLLVLCMENAFAHRLDVTQYRSGFSLIWEALIEWIQAFNNFRVAFLVMLLHDAPITLLNFFFIASCRCAGPYVLPWSLLISSLSSVVSLSWRITMLYFAYRRMLCALKSEANVKVARHSKLMEHLQWATDYRNGGRLEEYDELWPVRWARCRIFSKPENAVGSPFAGSNTRKDTYVQWITLFLLSTLPVCGAVLLCIKRSAKFVICVILSVTYYFIFFGICCIPCCYHYTCRQHSFYHRHKCSRTFIRCCSHIFHFTVLIVSLLGTVSLIVLNFILLSSVHIIGSNTLPPEIDQICITLLPTSRSIHAAVLPSPVLPFHSLEQNVNMVFLPDDKKASTVCKSLWKDGEFGIGLRRKEAGPWQTRRRFNNRLIAVATQVIMNNTIPEEAYLELRFDHALMLELGPLHDHMFACVRGEQSGWQFISHLHHTSWPYFLGCRQNWRFIEKNLIECFNIKSRISQRRHHARREHRRRRDERKGKFD